MPVEVSWLDQLVSSTGIPGAVGTLAISMYGACRAAESVARKEALRDISRALRNVSWSDSLKPAAITNYVFVTTFGRRHLSLHCIASSALATVVFWFVGSLVMHYEIGTPVSTLFTNLLERPYIWLTFIVVCGFVPDYIALWKTRGLLQRWPHSSSAGSNLTLVVSDVFLSILIAYVAVTLGAAIEDARVGSVAGYAGSFWTLFIQRLTSWYIFVFVVDYISVGPPSEIITLPGPIWLIFASSTLLTSIWTTLVLVSSILIKVVTPVQHFTVWFFDVEKKPIQAIGVVSGALVVFGGLVWSLFTKI
jgi:hypothetical protein